MPLKRDLGLLEAISLSIAMLTPTIATSFNTVFAVQAAGAVAPLAFLIGMVAMLIVGACFAAFERRVRSHGSVYSYLAHTFGAQWGVYGGVDIIILLCSLDSGYLRAVGHRRVNSAEEVGGAGSEPVGVDIAIRSYSGGMDRMEGHEDSGASDVGDGGSLDDDHRRNSQ